MTIDSLEMQVLDAATAVATSAPKWDILDVSRRMLMDAGFRADANETIMHARSLTQVLSRPFFYKYAEIRYADHIPISYEINTGARVHTYMQYDELGKADVVADYGGELPNADIVGFETPAKIVSVGTSFQYSIQDLRSAAFANLPLESWKSVIARRVLERKIDAMAAVGDARFTGTTLATGLANDPNLIAVTKGSQASGTTWATATPNEILTDITTMYTTIFNNTKARHVPNTLLLGTKGYGLISSLRLDSFNMTTVIAYLQQALPWLKKIDYWPQLDAAGASSKERILLGEFNDENIQAFVPQEFEMFPPQARQLTYTIPCHKRWGGVSLRYPKAFAYMDGTQP